MDNLGKENFWNAMHDRFPLAVDLFCKWIDEYKNEVNWNYLFGNYVIGEHNHIKFHDLPYEMQMGIMNRFFIESFASKEEYDLVGRSGEYRNEMEYTIEELNNRLADKN